MEDKDKTREEVIEELQALRKRMFEIKETEATHKWAEELYKTLFEQSPDAIVVIDPKTTLPVRFNDKALELIGYTRDEFRIVKVADYEVIESPEEIQKHIRKIIEHGSDEFETMFRTKTGQIKNVIVNIRVIEIEGKKYFHNIFRDITERKQAEEEIKKRVKELEKFYEMAVNRELRMKELKEKIKKIEAELANYKKDKE